MSKAITLNLYELAIELIQSLHEKGKADILKEFQKVRISYPDRIYPNIDDKKENKFITIYIITFSKICSIHLIYNNIHNIITGAFIILEDINSRNDFIKVIEDLNYKKYYSEFIEGKTWRNEKYIILEEIKNDKCEYTVLFKSTLQKAVKYMAYKLY